MTDSHDPQAAASAGGDPGDESFGYPTNHVVGVLDTAEQVGDAVAALTAGGFLTSEIQVVTGPAAADRMQSHTGRLGFSNLVVRVAQRLGIANDEMRLKARHEEALRDGHFLVLVATPSDERKDLAARMLGERGAYTLAHMGRFSIEGFVQPPEH